MPRPRGAIGEAPAARRSWLLPFLVAGTVCIIAGGLLAAATAYVTTQQTAWATAYIVLVGGVAQIGLGAGVAWLSPHAGARLAHWAFAGWNLGNAGVLAGQLAAVVVLTDIGTAFLVATLVLVLIAVRGRHAADTPAHPGVLFAFRALVVLLAVSMPVGVVLAHLG